MRKTEFILNEMVLNNKHLKMTQETVIDMDKMTSESKYIIRVSKNGTGMKLVFENANKALAKFAELIKTQKVEG